jgi:hypothetical protein
MVRRSLAACCAAGDSRRSHCPLAHGRPLPAGAGIFLPLPCRETITGTVSIPAFPPKTSRRPGVCRPLASYIRAGILSQHERTMPLFPSAPCSTRDWCCRCTSSRTRYRQGWSATLLDGPEPQQFGVIAIRKGRETGVDGISALYEIGCTADVRQVHAARRRPVRRGDGRRPAVPVCWSWTTHGPYLQCEIEPVSRGDRATRRRARAGGPRAVLAARSAVFGRAANPGGGPESTCPTLPDEPVLLSYLVAASMIVDLSDRQVCSPTGRAAPPDRRARTAGEGKTKICAGFTSDPGHTTWEARPTYTPTSPDPPAPGFGASRGSRLGSLVLDGG